MADLPKYICIHGHFYQPPRENPWLRVIEIQDSASPFHDWNERVEAECYAPNAVSRLLNPKGQIRRVANNYVHISFNFGPTLIAWIEKHDPRTYEKIIEADRISRERRGGHGNALAQPYNHIVMPLAGERDRRTQLVWGMEDFRRRFGRDPEGMWLPETAVNTETLAMMAEMDIRFTILSPTQAARMRVKGGQWTDTPNGSIDPSRAYTINLPGGRSMALFFYDGPISNAVAFEKILENGEFFLGRLREAFNPRRTWAQLVHIANDGESYGHHHRFADMALAYVIEKILERNVGVLTNYGQYLERHPPETEVEIVENSSWSCVHGVERWRSDCGCCAGTHPGWNQKWRAPLRQAFENLKARADELFETAGAQWFDDPWQTRDRYIEAVLNGDPLRSARFVREQAANPALSDEDVSHCLCLLEMQRNAMLMFTSCAWFFDEISGIEPAQNMRYAAQVIQMGAVFNNDWEAEFLDDLALAPSNLARIGNGRAVYERQAQPSIVTLRRAAAHYAIVRALDPDDQAPDLPGYDVAAEDFERSEDGTNMLAVGRARVAARITLQKSTASFAVLHFGGRDIQCGVADSQSNEDYHEMKRLLIKTFQESTLADVLRTIDRYFVRSEYSLRDLFVEARRRVLDTLTREASIDIEAALQATYERYRPFMTLLRESDAPPPAAFRSLTSLVLERELREGVDVFIEKSETRPLAQSLEEARRWNIELDFRPLTRPFKESLLAEYESLARAPASKSIRAFVSKLSKAHSVGLQAPRWELQNRFHDHFCKIRDGLAAAAKTDGEALKQLEAWRSLARLLDFDPQLIDPPPQA